MQITYNHLRKPWIKSRLNNNWLLRSSGAWFSTMNGCRWPGTTAYSPVFSFHSWRSIRTPCKALRTTKKKDGIEVRLWLRNRKWHLAHFPLFCLQSGFECKKTLTVAHMLQTLANTIYRTVLNKIPYYFYRENKRIRVVVSHLAVHWCREISLHLF